MKTIGIVAEGPRDFELIAAVIDTITNEENSYQMIIRTYLDYPIEVVARKLKVRPNTISKARRKIARELRKKLV